MITFSSEKELIDYLMTSDFSGENISPEDLKYLLDRFKYYYRMKHSQVIRSDNEIDKLNKRIKRHENTFNVIKKELEVNEFRYDRIKSKKLSLKERIKGKIEE